MASSIAKNSIWLILPALNEARYIEQVLKKVSAVHPHIIVVNDGSTDTTADIAQKFTPHVLTHLTNLGKGAAMKTGCEYAFNTLGAQAVIFFDSDDQHQPTEIAAFIEQLQAGHQIVLGVRSFDEKMPLTRIMMNRLASVVVKVLFGEYIPDIPSGFKAFTKSAYMRIKWTSSDYAVEMEIAVRIAQQKLPFTTLPIETIYHDLDRGMSLLHTLRMIQKLIGWRLGL